MYGKFVLHEENHILVKHSVVDKGYDDVRSDIHLCGPGEVREGMM